MECTKIPFEEVGNFSRLFLDYLNKEASVDSFYHHYPSIENVEEQIAQKKGFQYRETLVEVLSQQYGAITNTPKVLENIALLAKPTTFTVTTGHQLSVLTGPLFFIYKIVATINLTEELKKKYPNNDFIPVFWMASEDHDYEEIKGVNLFGKTHAWETDQQGAVGRFHLDDFPAVLDGLPEQIELLNEAYTNQQNLAQATRQLVNALFADYGLVIIDGDDKTLKSLVAPYWQKEIEEKVGFQKVNQTIEQLKLAGYKAQINPREINLFRLTDHSRKRLVHEGDYIKEIDGNWSLPLNDLQDYLKENPEEFSPNVVLRPLYQEVILPNIAYLGGPAEVIYWLELKSMFEAFEVPFPFIMPRGHGIYINKGLSKKLAKFKLTASQLFLDEKQLKQAYITANGDEKCDLEEEINTLTTIFKTIETKTNAIDPSLCAFVNAEYKKIEKQVSNIQKRLEKAEERNYEQGLTQLARLKEKLFPNEGLQERFDNLFSFLINNPNFIEEIKPHLNPIDFKFHIWQDA